jgi:hypothetical protein
MERIRNSTPGQDRRTRQIWASRRRRRRLTYPNKLVRVVSLAATMTPSVSDPPVHLKYILCNSTAWIRKAPRRCMQVCRWRRRPTPQAIEGNATTNPTKPTTHFVSSAHAHAGGHAHAPGWVDVSFSFETEQRSDQTNHRDVHGTCHAMHVVDRAFRSGTRSTLVSHICSLDSSHQHHCTLFLTVWPFGDRPCSISLTRRLGLHRPQSGWGQLTKKVY